MKINLPNTLTLINFTTLLVFSAFWFLDNSRMVYVDSARLINSYQGMVDARAAYQQKAVTWKANIDTLTQEVKQKIMAYEKESSKMTTRERQLSQELIKARQNQLMQYQQAMKAQAEQEDAKMTGEVITQINSYLKSYGESKGYTIIMAATEYGNLAYADEKLDITAEVLKGLNDQYAGR